MKGKANKSSQNKKEVLRKKRNLLGRLVQNKIIQKAVSEKLLVYSTCQVEFNFGDKCKTTEVIVFTAMTTK